jgi:hypothetical protein
VANLIEGDISLCPNCGVMAVVVFEEGGHNVLFVHRGNSSQRMQPKPKGELAEEDFCRVPRVIAHKKDLDGRVGVVTRELLQVGDRVYRRGDSVADTDST